MGNVIEVDAHWDARANVWVASSEDVIDLTIEAPSIYKLRENLADVLEDLIGPMESKIRFRLVDMHERQFGDRFVEI